MVEFPEFEHIRYKDPVLYDGLKKVSQAWLEISSKSGVGVGSSHAAPPTIGGVNVTTNNGWASITIDDPAGAGQGIIRPLHYAVFYDTVPGLNVASSFQHYLGPYRVARIYVGNAVYYWGAHSFYLDSPASPIVMNPTAMPGGGYVQPPDLPKPPAGGISGIGPGGGFGRGSTRPTS